MSSKNSPKHSLPIGVGFFREMVLDYDLYVDKTRFIKDVIENKSKSLLLTHPRRWGKSLNMDMLKSFLEIEPEHCSVKYKPLLSWEVGVASLRKIDVIGIMEPHHAVANEFQSKANYVCNSEIFRDYGLAISHELDSNKLSIVETHQGRYPVISLTLKGLYGDNYETIEQKLKIVIKNVFRNFSYLAQSSKLTTEEKLDFSKHLEINYDGITIQGALYFLTRLLYKHHGEKVYILVDEYDKPINALLEEFLGSNPRPDLAKLISNVTRLISETVCAEAGKDNIYLEKLVLTGIFDTTYKESGSGCNNIATYGVADSGFSEHFGFSEDEVKKLVSTLEFANHEQVLDNIKDWYNGYSIPTSSGDYMRVYTPWAVMRYLDLAYNHNDFNPINYWTISGASTILKKLITKETCQQSIFSTNLMTIAQNNTVSLDFDKNISLFNYDWFADIDNQGFFTYLLLNSGYLTARLQDGTYFFSIPNAELLDEFSKLLTKQDGFCAEILNNLHRTTHQKSVALIKSDDAAALESIFSQGYVDCQDYSMNFNFFHLAAIYGSAKVFRSLLNSKCVAAIDFANDRTNNLKAIDYALLLGRGEVIEVIKEFYQNKPQALISLPSWSDSLFCFTHYSKTLGAVASGAIDFTKDALLGPLSSLFKAFGYISSAVFETRVDDYLGDWCSGVERYLSIDISTPSQFTRIEQFMKYLIKNSDSRVIADASCGVGECELSSLEFDIFQNSFYSNEKLVLHLCEPCPQI